MTKNILKVRSTKWYTGETELLMMPIWRGRSISMLLASSEFDLIFEISRNDFSREKYLN